ncbi:hypothetical protein FGADI_125 [Fusarium gaditjirri]|uniref:Uncharacterized protein n=1 Tax=Fusarium gaditjirri TaxID=282569 RepID=A0A8H4TPQ9_9HYPO|nr:hypothetical protein FGADI_125 [Fusarium gaditjirri]
MNQFDRNQDQMTWSAQASLKTITYMLQLQLQNRTVVVSDGYKIRRLVKSSHPCLVKRSPPHVASPTVEEVIQTSIYHPRFSTRTTDIGRPVRVLNIFFAILGIRSLQHSTAAQQHSIFALKEKLSPVGQGTHIALSLGLRMASVGFVIVFIR